MWLADCFIHCGNLKELLVVQPTFQNIMDHFIDLQVTRVSRDIVAIQSFSQHAYFSMFGCDF